MMSDDKPTMNPTGLFWALLFTALLWVFIILAFSFGTGCTPISKSESQRINQDYNDYYNRTRGMKVRR